MYDCLVLAEILYIKSRVVWFFTSPEPVLDHEPLRQVQRFLDFAEDIEYDGSLHGDLRLDERNLASPNCWLFSIHNWLGMPKK